MTPFASVCLFKRDGKIVFRPPRKERPHDLTQARKAASRYWSRLLKAGETFGKTIVVREAEGRIEISEKTILTGWTQYRTDAAQAAREPHLAACLAELGVSSDPAQPFAPDILVINGFTYRREI